MTAVALGACGSDDNQYGDPCSGPCDNELSCLQDSRFPGGYCTNFCMRVDDCREGGFCDLETGAGVCYRTCAAASDCREGYQCWHGGCRPSCSSDAECGIGASCREGLCDGAECSADAHCPGGQCLAGACILSDAGPVDCNATCEGLCLGPEYGVADECMAPCADALDCPEGHNCVPVPHDTDGDDAPEAVVSTCIPYNDAGRTHGGACSGDAGGTAECDGRVCYEGQCIIACDDNTDCLLGQTCQERSWQGATFRTCYDTPDITELPLGFDTLTPGGVQRVDFVVPRDATSVTYVMRQVDGRNLPLTFVELTDPTDDILYDLDELPRGIDQPIRWLPYDTSEAAAMLVPNSTPDRVELLPGRHRLVYGVLPQWYRRYGRRACLRALAPRRAAAPRLALRVYMTPGVGVSAATAPGDRRLQAALSTFAGTFAAAGIGVSVESYADLSDSAFDVIDSTDGPDNELARLFSLSGSSSGDVLNVFLVRSIDAERENGIALGIAGGIPGPPGEHGTTHSGVVVSFDPMVAGSAINVGQIVGS